MSLFYYLNGKQDTYWINYDGKIQDVNAEDFGLGIMQTQLEHKDPEELTKD